MNNVSQTGWYMARAIFFALWVMLSAAAASALAQDIDKIVKTPELEMQLISAVTATGDLSLIHI